MNTPDKPSMLERSTIVRCGRLLGRCGRWLFSRRGLRRALIGLAWCVTLLALFHAEEAWRGRRAWNQYRRELESQGWQLDFAALVPKLVPDEQNFAAAPVIKAWFDGKRPEGLYGEKWRKWVDQRWNDNYARVDPKWSLRGEQNARPGWRFEDLARWATAFAAVRFGESPGPRELDSAKLDAASRSNAAPAVLEELKTNETLFAELRAASQRPYSRYPVNYGVETPYGVLPPHLDMMNGACWRLRLKSCAELAGGQSDRALEDVRLILRLADSLKGEPLMISYMVRRNSAELAVQPIWEGLAEHRWSEAQLQELETRLQQYDFIEDLKAPLAGSQAAALATIEAVRKKGPGYLSVLMDSCEAESSEAPHRDEATMLENFLGFVLIPRGWYDQEKLNYCRDFQIQAAALDTTKKRISPAQVKASQRALWFPTWNGTGGLEETKWVRILRHRSISTVMGPLLKYDLHRAAGAQTTFNLAAIACALERYRLAKGCFPGALETLVPQFISPLPNDVLTGEPYKYRLTDEGRLVLYSVGWNEKDDGGVPGESWFSHPDDPQGDCVWEYPAK
jgi:hypothetical protein